MSVYLPGVTVWPTVRSSVLASSLWTLTGTALPFSGCNTQLRARSIYFQSASVPFRGKGDFVPAGSEGAFPTESSGGPTLGTREAHMYATLVCRGMASRLPHTPSPSSGSVCEKEERNCAPGKAIEIGRASCRERV